MNFSEWAVAEVEREAAEHAERERVGSLAPARQRSRNAVSTVFTLRLDNDELAALRVRAAAADVAPSVLARNYIRMGLTRPQVGASEALDRIETAVAQLRASVHRV